MSPIAITIIILVLMIAGFMSGKLPLGVCGFFCSLALLVTRVLTPAEAFAGFSNTNVVIMVSMMIVSAGLMKTSLVDKILGLIKNVGGKGYVGIIASFGIIVAILAQFMNAFVAVACMLPLITGICDDLKISRPKIIFPIATIALCWIQMFPIGYGAGVFAQMNGYLEAFNSPPLFGMWTLTATRLPGAIITSLYCIFIMSKTCPVNPSMKVRDDLGKKLEKSNLSALQERVAYIIAVGTIVMMMTSSFHGIATYTCAAVGAFLMVLVGVLNEKECFSSVNWGLVFMFAGILPLATALTKTGASDIVANAIQGLLGGTTNVWLINIAFTLTAWILTQFMSNLAMINVFTPLALMVCINAGMDPVGVMGLINIAAGASLLTPMATPSIPLVMGAGGYNFKDIVKTGFIPALLQVVVGMIWCTFMFPAFK